MNAQEELNATRFAMELLMPVKFVKDYIKANRVMSLEDDLAIKDMAKHFKVPMTVMAGRLWSLKTEGAI